MRAVLDTNTFISAFINNEGLPYQAIELWFNRKYDLVTSEWQIEELRDVSRRHSEISRNLPFNHHISKFS